MIFPELLPDDELPLPTPCPASTGIGCTAGGTSRTVTVVAGDDDAGGTTGAEDEDDEAFGLITISSPDSVVVGLCSLFTP